MSKKALIAGGLILAVLGFGSGLLVRDWASPPAPVPEAATDAGSQGARRAPAPQAAAVGPAGAASEAAPPFNFVDQDGEARAIGDWSGKVVVVNFWATWCAPCLVEIPFFIETQKQLGPRGLQFVGVALDDSDKVKAFVAELGMNYPTAHGQQDALDLMRAYGNNVGGLPFTAFIGRDGRIAHSKAGVLTEEELAEVLEELLGST